jgi:hypothetical protein
MLDGLAAALRRDRQEWVIREESQAIVKIITDAVKPASLYRAVTEQMALTRNKPLKKDVYRFVRWLREYAIGHERFVGYEEEPKPFVKPDQPKAQQGNVRAAGQAPAQATPKAPVAAQTPQGPAGRTPVSGCLKCKSASHKVRDCPGITEEEASRLLKAHGRAIAQRRADNDRGHGTPGGRVAVMKEKAPTTGRNKLLATVEGLVSVQASLLDSGADMSVASGGLISALLAAGSTSEITVMGPFSLYPYGADSKPVVVTKQARLGSLEFKTACGPLMLRGLRVWVDEAVSAVELTLGLPVMQKLGYDEQTLLENACRQQAEWDFSDQPVTTPGVAMHRTLRMAELSDGIDDDEGMCCATPELGPIAEPDDGEPVRTMLMTKVADAAAKGLEESAVEDLRDLLLEYQDVFRLKFGRDPPVKVEPLKVHLKPGSVPVKSGLRRYPPTHLEFLEKHVRELEEAGLVYRNTRSRWAAAPRIVPKKDPGDLRMTIDSRPINACTEPMPWPMPNLEVAMGVLKDSKVYFTLDWMKGYWQLPLHPDSQEYYSFMTPIGVVTPTRVLMGQSDAVAYCQGVVDELFGDLLMHGLLGWLDDLLGYAGSADDLLRLLREVFRICESYGLKLHPGKCTFYTTRTIWCGKEISSDGVAHAPGRVQGLCDLEPPQTAADLQQFLCATNWMRANIPQYTELVAPLTKLLDIAAKAADSRKKTALTRVSLSSVGWCEDHLTCFERVKTTLKKMVPLSHPDPNKMVCLYTDASDGFWGAIATQVPTEDLALAAADQRHEPLAFLSGAFRGSSERWPIVEKEAFAVAESCKRLEYLLIRPGGFRLFTDHRNLVYMFNPLGYNSNMAKYQAHKLQRWALTMTTFPYVVECVAGEDNLWADLLSRWGNPEIETRTARMNKLALVSPLRADSFVWPTADAITALQRDHPECVGHATWCPDKKCFLSKSGQIWIPDDALDMQMRICVVAHAGAAGHRRLDATMKSVSDMFDWTSLKADVKNFVTACLHCMVVDGESIPRPWGEALHATKPNELIHFDWLSLPGSDEGLKYILVIKDDMSGFVRLHPSTNATAAETAAAMMEWFGLFGVVKTWVSDSGSHFKNEVITKMGRLFGAHHHFVTPHCPWANGTVEVVNRVIVRTLKVLCSEMRLNSTDWPKLLPLVQSALNQQPADRLDGIAPTTAFTGLPATPPLTGLVHPDDARVESIDWITSESMRHVTELAHALHVMHKHVAATAAKKRAKARAVRAGKTSVKLANFALGDFVLVARALRHPSKLTLRWKGPYRVVRVVSDHLMEVQQLVPPAETTLHHTSRLRLYCEGGREVDEDLKAQIAFGDEGFYVEELQDMRLHNGAWEVKIKWLGLDDLESSWEPATSIYEDVPVLFRRWAVVRRDEDGVGNMIQDIETTFGHPL